MTWLAQQVGVLMFGNSFPDNAASSLEQGFSLLIAALGIASFAISLALVEQVVLENLDANVRRGSQVYEHGHVRGGAGLPTQTHSRLQLVVLMWGTSQRDVEVTQTILQQACVAFAAEGGRAVVVLSHKPKVEMEEFFMCVQNVLTRPTRFCRFCPQDGCATCAAQWYTARVSPGQPT